MRSETPTTIDADYCSTPSDSGGASAVVQEPVFDRVIAPAAYGIVSRSRDDRCRGVYRRFDVNHVVPCMS